MLWIRSFDGDTGNRPGAGQPWTPPAPRMWLSPALCATSGATETGTIAPGQNYGIRTTVNNDDSAAGVADVSVQMWACRLSTAPVAALGGWKVTAAVPQAPFGGVSTQAFNTPGTWQAPTDGSHVCLIANFYFPQTVICE